MNALSLAYFIVHTGTGPILWIVNAIIYLLMALLLFLIFQWIAAEFNVPPKIVKLIGLIIFLCALLALLGGCQQDSRSAKAWVPTAAESDGQP